ncbi:unnamed protein product [Schistosoma guineensis]|nr:unnamed protein product [Schistosoma guineensis]
MYLIFNNHVAAPDSRASRKDNLEKISTTILVPCYRTTEETMGALFKGRREETKGQEEISGKYKLQTRNIRYYDIYKSKLNDEIMSFTWFYHKPWIVHNL